MSSNKADQGQRREANKQALNCFPKTKLRASLDVMAESKQVGDDAKEAKANAALKLCVSAESYSSKAHEICGDDTSTVLKDWREGVKLLAKEMAVDGHKFVEANEKDGVITARLSGYGNNVMSIAKGVVEYQVEIEDEASYRDVRTTVEAIRATQRSNEAIELADSKQACKDAFAELTGIIFPLSDVELIDDLTQTLMELTETATAQAAEQAELEAHVETEAEAAESDAAHAEGVAAQEEDEQEAEEVEVEELEPEADEADEVEADEHVLGDIGVPDDEANQAVA